LSYIFIKMCTLFEKSIILKSRPGGLLSGGLLSVHRIRGLAVYTYVWLSLSVKETEISASQWTL